MTAHEFETGWGFFRAPAEANGWVVAAPESKQKGVLHTLTKGPYTLELDLTPDPLSYHFKLTSPTTAQGSTELVGPSRGSPEIFPGWGVFQYVLAEHIDNYKI